MATEFKLPEVGEGITSGTVVGVLVSVGDTISEDQAILELETDKAVVEVPSTVSGVVQEIRVKENEEASVGQVVLVVGEGDGAGDSAAAEVSEEAETQAEADAPQGEPEASSSEEEEAVRAEGTEAAPSEKAPDTEKPASPKTTDRKSVV